MTQSPTQGLSVTRSLDAWEALKSTFSTFELRRVAGCPEKRLPLLKRVLLKQASPRSAIKAMCQQCLGYEDVQKGIRDCTAKACPIYAYRPYQAKP